VEIVMSLQTIGSFLIYFVAALIAMAIFIVLYMAVTSHHEIALIKQGNTAAAISFAGALLGFTLPLTSAVVNAVSLIDMLVWSAIALVVQIVVFLVVDLLMRQVSRHIEGGNVAAGITLGAASLAIGMINAASMTY